MKIKEDLIPDYKYWFNKKDITKEESLLVVSEINPEYFNENVKLENKLSKISHFDEVMKMVRADVPNTYFGGRESINSIFEEGLNAKEKYNLFRKRLTTINNILSENIEFFNLYNLCNQLYEKGYELSKSLLDFLDSQNKKPTHFDHYKNKEQYFADYNKLLDKANIGKITKEEALYLIVGLNPEFAIKCNKITNKYQNQINELGQYQFKDWDNEDRFFYLFYCDYVATYDIDEINEIQEKLKLEYNDFFTFVEDLYKLGYVPCDELLCYLNKNHNKSLSFNENGNIYKTYKQYCDRIFWTVEDLFYLLRGYHPSEKTKLITFFNSCSKNHTRIRESYNDKNKYWALLKDDSSTQDLEDFISKFIEKNEKGYNPKDLLIKVKEYVDVEIPQILTDLVLNRGNANNTQKNKSSETRGAKTRIDYKLVWEIFIMDILGDENYQYEEGKESVDAYKAYNELQEEKKNMLRFFLDGKKHQENIVISFRGCKKIAVTPADNIHDNNSDKKEIISRNTLIKNIIQPFLDKFSNN
jgi:hypothetical protein